MNFSEFITKINSALNVFFTSWIGAFVSGFLSSIIASFAITAIDKGKSLYLFERKILQSISHHRLRRIRNTEDPHALIRNEWAIALRDLVSKKDNDVRRALETLFHSADALDPVERDIAREAVRLRIAFNNNRDIDTKYLKVMERLS
jgi:hypothetical protein